METVYFLVMAIVMAYFLRASLVATRHAVADGAGGGYFTFLMVWNVWNLGFLAFDLYFALH